MFKMQRKGTKKIMVFVTILCGIAYIYGKDKHTMVPPIASAVRFNTLKHHCRFLRIESHKWRGQSREAVTSALKKLGANQFDIYTGYLSVSEIGEQVAAHLSRHGIATRHGLKQWLGRKAYREIYLDDGSRWVVRESEDKHRFIHIHPGRSQEYVRRVKANHIKTALMLMREYAIPSAEGLHISLADINRVRSEMLELSPVRSISECRKILMTLKFLIQDE